jgi:hypothetical protein
MDGEEEHVMSENHAKTPVPEFPASEGWPDYPGFGSEEDVQARIRLLDWIRDQIGVTIHPKVGDCVLATEWRILGVGRDPEELHDRVVAAEPALRNARLVAYCVPLSEY